MGKLQGLGFLPRTDVVRNTSGWLDDRGLVGGFLNGLIGYRAGPLGRRGERLRAYLLIAGTLPFIRRPDHHPVRDPWDPERVRRIRVAL